MGHRWALNICDNSNWAPSWKVLGTPAVDCGACGDYMSGKPCAPSELIHTDCIAIIVLPGLSVALVAACISLGCPHGFSTSFALDLSEAEARLTFYIYREGNYFTL